MSDGDDAPAGGSQVPGGKTTFITAVGEPEAMGRVKDLHFKIGNVVGHLNEKIALVLQKQEKEFLAAYRAHMLSVQKELQQLRAKANEAELAMKKNEKIRSLEDERNWYRKEALRLDKFATAMKKDLKYMKEKLESIEDDRKWLERQLKSSKKANKLLRADLEIKMMQREGSGSVRGSAIDEGEYGDGGSVGEERKPMFPPPNAHRAVTPSSPLGGRSRRDSRPGSRSDLRYLDDEEGAVAQYKAMLEKTRASLAAERKLVKQLRAHAVATSTQHSELETFFIKCIADVKKDVSRRRTKANQRSVKSRGGARGSTTPLGSSGRFDKDLSSDLAHTRAESPTLGDFTATDRRKVIRRLLSDDYVLQMLHQMIFGPGEEVDVTAGPTAEAGATFTGPAEGDMRSSSFDGPRSDFGRSDGMALDPTVADYLYGDGDGDDEE